MKPIVRPDPIGGETVAGLCAHRGITPTKRKALKRRRKLAGSLERINQQ
jgi:hypothetical protein